MTLEQQGAYINLLCHAWLNEGVPNDDAALARLSGAGERWLNDCSIPVRAAFVLKGDRLVNEKQEDIRENLNSRRETARLAGIESGKARRKAKKTLNDRSDSVQPKTNTAIAIAIASKDLKTNTPSDTQPDDINILADEIYNYYKQHVRSGAKASALKSIRVMLKTEGRSKDEIISAIDAYMMTDAYRKDGGSFRIQANNFFGQARRIDDFWPTDDDIVPVEDRRAAERKRASKMHQEYLADKKAYEEKHGNGMVTD